MSSSDLPIRKILRNIETDAQDQRRGSRKRGGECGLHQSVPGWKPNQNAQEPDDPFWNLPLPSLADTRQRPLPSYYFPTVVSFMSVLPSLRLSVLTTSFCSMAK